MLSKVVVRQEATSPLVPVTGLMLMNCCDAVVSCQIVPGLGVWCDCYCVFNALNGV